MAWALRLACGAVLLVALGSAPAAAQLPPAPTWNPELRPNMPRQPLPRIARQRDDEWRLGCAATVVEGLGVVTARHCGFGRAQIPVGSVAVQFGEERRRIVGATVPSEPFQVEGRPMQPQFDWAILEVEGPLPAVDRITYVGRAGLVTASRTAPLTKLGPGRGGPNAAPADGPCWPLEIGMGGTVFTFQCRDGTGPGRSGSPLLMRTADGWGFVGMHVAEFDTPEGKVGIAIVPPRRAD
ncbi:MAG: hypothetical protein EA356_15545 [Geminicoccaceae bacterium]|nr:MAG: hypothetical protein EA356_15545 [Geminicoccaceae bacterium]